MPVNVGLGTCGRTLWNAPSCSFVDGPSRLLPILRLHSSIDWPKGFLGMLFADPATNRARKAEIDTTITAMLDSCCCQNATQTMSTSPLASRQLEIRTIAITIITIDRHKESPKASRCLKPTRISQSRTIGKERTVISVITSRTVVIAVSRTTLKFPTDPEHAGATVSGIVTGTESHIHRTFSTAVKGHVSQSATVAPIHESTVIPRTHHHHTYNFGSRTMSLRKKNRKANLTG